MSRFVVSYDVKDSESSDDEKVLRDLVCTIVNNLSGYNIKRPVETTVNFEAPMEDAKVWGALAAWSKKHGVWYFASVIVESEDGKYWRSVSVPNNELQDHVSQMSEEAKSASEI